ncbi:hypothetical protein DCK84_31970 [Bradyrhizobium sp. WBOS01]|nr:hypothetical protein DCK84_31970 [Bradyrhizobium sp. WBOS01]
MAIIKKSGNNRCWRGCGEIGTLLHCWWDCKLVQPLWKSVWRFLRARCLVPECGGISQSDPVFREGLWDRYSTAAPRQRMPSELRYSDRRLRSKT